MSVRTRHFLLILCTGLILLVGVLWWGREPLIHNVLRPWLATRISETIGGRMDIETLTLDWPEVALHGVAVQAPGLRTHLGQVRLQLTLDGLTQKRIARLDVIEPEVMIRRDETAEASKASELPVPDKAPWTIASWQVVKGRLTIKTTGDRFELNEVGAAGQMGEKLSFTIHGRLGTTGDHIIRLAGDGDWREGPTLTVHDLSWGPRQLLQKPVTIRPGRDLSNLTVALSLPNLRASEVAALLSALDQPVPWPEAIAWSITEPRVVGSLQNGTPFLNVRTGPGRVQWHDDSWPWQSLQIVVDKTGLAWQLETTLDLAGEARISCRGQWQDGRFTGHLETNVPDPALLAQSLALPKTTLIRHIEHLQASTELHIGREEIRTESGRFSIRAHGTQQLTGGVESEWNGQSLAVVVKDVTWSDPTGAEVLMRGSAEAIGDPAANAWHGQWQATTDRLRPIVRGLAPAVDANWPDLQKIKLSGSFAHEAGQTKLTVAEMSGRLTGSEVHGSLTGKLAVASAAKNGWLLTVDRLTLDALDYNRADGSLAAAGGRLNLHGQIDYGPQKTSFSLHGQSSVAEALIDIWYGQLDHLPLAFNLQGGWHPGEKTLQLSRFDFELADLLSGTLTGRTTPNSQRYALALSIPQLSGSFNENLQQMAGEVVPAIQKLQLAGALSVHADYRTADTGWRLALDLLPDDVAAEYADTTAVKGLTGALPVILQVGAMPDQESPLQGHLSWTELQTPLVAPQTGGLMIEASSNRWRLLQPLTLAAAGGQLQLENLDIRWPGFAPVAEASLSLTGLELRDISQSLDWPELGGRLSASLDSIRFSTEEISTNGEATAQAFDGNFRMRNLKIFRPLSRYPTYEADVDFNGLDLAALTQTFAFGEINGVASGFVHDLRLFGGTPSAFEARFETAASGTRNISVKAIRNLNTLSQGGLSAALSQGIYQFIDFYRYRKIGFTCSLQNDIFTLRGTARADSDRYLVDGGWLPPKIDVTISSPTIAFKEMMERLKRIERTER